MHNSRADFRFVYALISILIPATIFLFYNIFNVDKIIKIDIHVSLAIFALIYSIMVKKARIIFKTLILEKNERKTLIASTIFFTLFSLINPARTGIEPLLNVNIPLLFKTFIEEIVFRGLQLGIAMSSIQLVKYRLLPFYWVENLRDALFTVALTFIFGIIFSLSHTEWLYDFSYFYRRLSLGFALGLVFVFTNRKIYASWILHYVNNAYAPFLDCFLKQ